MAAPIYADVHELEDRLGIPLNDTREAALSEAISGASRWIDKQTARRFYTLTETRYYSAKWHYPSDGYASHGAFGAYPWGYPERPFGGGLASQHLSIDDFVSVSAVATDDNGDGTFPTTWTVGTDFWLGPRNATLEGKPFRSINRTQATGRYVFPPWENGVSVTGACGYSTAVPDEIRELCMTVAMLFARPVMEMIIPGVQSYRLANDLSVTMRAEDLPFAAQETLSHYRDGLFGV